MAHNSPVECIRIIATNDRAILHCEDGSALQMRREVFGRSSLLLQTVSDTGGEEEVSVSLPKGVIKAWLEALAVLGIDANTDEKGPVSPAQKLFSRSKSILECLQAADFLGDRSAVTELCAKASHLVFVEYINSGDEKLDSELVKELCALPGNLQRAVLATSKVPVLLQLSLLPEALHQTALHAAFPSIAATSSLTAHCPLHTCTFVDPFWHVLGKETGLKALQFTLQNTLTAKRPALSQGLIACLPKLTSLESLTLANLDLGNKSIIQILKALSCQSVLTHLDISRNRVRLGAHELRLEGCLANLTALRSLDISGNRCEHDGGNALGSCISLLHQLQSLNIDDCLGFLNQDQGLENHLSRCTSLQVLKLGRYACGLELFQSLCCCSGLQLLKLPNMLDPMERQKVALIDINRISSLSNLQELHFPDMGSFNATFMKGLAEHITSAKTLRSLHIRSQVRKDLYVTALGSLFARQSCLESFHMRGAGAISATSAEGERAFAAALSTVTKLKHILLGNMLMHPEGAEAVISSFQGLTDLQTLHLERISMSSAGAKALADVLPHLPSIQHLNISDNNLPVDAMQYLATPLGMLSALHTLSFACNEELFTQGDQGFAEQLPNLTSLKDLDLSGTGMSDAACVAIARHLGCLTALQRLALNNAHVSHEAMKALARAFTKLTALEYLGLALNRLTCVSIEVLCSNLESLAALQRLDLRMNSISKTGACALVRCVRTLPSLKVLDLEHNSIAKGEHFFRNLPYESLIVRG